MEKEDMRICRCTTCGDFEYYGKLERFKGKILCRKCHKKAYTEFCGVDYPLQDYSHVPTKEEYEAQYFS